MLLHWTMAAECVTRNESAAMPTTINLEQFTAILLLQGVPMEHLAFKCPICKTVQSASDLIAAGAGQNFDQVEKYLAFSCVGRFTNAGPHEGNAPGKGCDWSLGGLFRLHELEVITEEGESHPRFMPASPEEAQAHMNLTNGATA